MAELTDLGRIHSMLFWDQNTMMPPNGAAARADHSATLEVISHDKLIDPEIGRLLDALAPWADVRGPRLRRRPPARRRPARPREGRARPDRARRRDEPRRRARPAGVAGGARGRPTSALFRDALERHIELRHRYVACFEPAEHPYDILLDDFEPELTTAELQAAVRQPPRRRSSSSSPRSPATTGSARNDGVFSGPFEVDDQRRAVMDVLEAVGFDADGWRLDPAPHPFAQSLGPTDVRITTRYDLQRLRRRALLRPARVRPRPLRGRHRARARAQPARPAGLARHPRVAEPAVGERRRPLAPVLRLGAAEAARAPRPRHPRRASTSTRSTARSTRSSAR